MLTWEPVPACPRKLSKAARSCCEKEVVESAEVALFEAAALVDVIESVTAVDVTPVVESMGDKLPPDRRKATRSPNRLAQNPVYGLAARKFTFTGNSMSKGATIT